MHNIETSMILKRLPTIPENHEAVKQDLAQLTHCAFATTATTYITNIGLKYHLESFCESADMWEEKSWSSRIVSGLGSTCVLFVLCAQYVLDKEENVWLLAYVWCVLEAHQTIINAHVGNNIRHVVKSSPNPEWVRLANVVSHMDQCITHVCLWCVLYVSPSLQWYFYKKSVWWLASHASSRMFDIVCCVWCVL